MIQILLLSLLVSLDGLFCGLTFAIKKIRLSAKRLGLISFCPFLIVSAVMSAAGLIGRQLNEGAIRGLSFVLFFILAYLSLTEALRKRGKPSLLTLIRNPSASDLNQDRQISAKEALLMGMALSLDNAVMGLDFALRNAPVLPVAAGFALINFTLVWAGSRCRWPVRWTRLEKVSDYLPAVLFALLAFLRLK